MSPPMRSRSPRSPITVWKARTRPLLFQTESYYTVRVDDPDLLKRLEDNEVEVEGEKPDTNSTLLDILLVYVLPVALYGCSSCF